MTKKQENCYIQQSTIAFHLLFVTCLAVFDKEDVTGKDKDKDENQSELTNDNKCATEIGTPSSDEEEIKDSSNSEDDTEAGITNREVEEVMHDVARKNCGSSNTCR